MVAGTRSVRLLPLAGTNLRSRRVRLSHDGARMGRLAVIGGTGVRNRALAHDGAPP
jgi:hypothetical protein